VGARRRSARPGPWKGDGRAAFLEFLLRVGTSASGGSRGDFNDHRVGDSAGKRRFKWVGPVKLGDAVKAREELNVQIRRREVIVSGEAKTFRTSA
jgi:acyl dehydratase